MPRRAGPRTLAQYHVKRLEDLPVFFIPSTIEYFEKDIIGRCTHVVDRHTGDANEDLRPYAGYYHYPDTPALSATGRQRAALGFPYVAEVLAPVNGIVLFLIAPPPINRGDTLFSIGELPAASQP